MLSVLNKIKSIVGSENFLDSALDKHLYSYDATPLFRELPEAIAIPRSAEHVSAILKLATESGLPIVPRGSGSGLSGGSIPSKGSLVLLFPPMNRILEIDEVNMTCTVEPGVITAVLQNEVEKHGLFYPPDPGSATISTLGGNIAENAGGLRGLKYGVTKNYVMTLDVVLPSGELITLGNHSIKDVQGLNLKDVFIGSEGTLGVITKATLRLLPKPKTSQVILFHFDSIARVGEFVASLALSKITPAMFEFLDNTTIRAVESYTKIGLPESLTALVLIELDGHPAEVHDDTATTLSIAEKAGATFSKLAESNIEAQKLKQARKSAFSALARLKPTTILEDASVPRSHLPEMLLFTIEKASELNLLVGNFGHLGDGNLHPTCLITERDANEIKRSEQFFEQIFDKAVSLGGTITGEHGTGIAKKKYLEKAAGHTQVELMRRFKASIDEANILNPGKIFDTSHFFKSKCERHIPASGGYSPHHDHHH
ncbi:MAG: FAD-linked oxidase C-terminal domain-containing protein [Chloroherpetonaceae bacterium]|nr:FAD-linked oxidase C-terminal domain-containing protein [Chloroherpetonaceae bacterium]